MRNTEERHETRLKNMNSTIDNVRALMNIQEEYICWLEKQVEALSGMSISDYFKEHQIEYIQKLFTTCLM